MDDATDWASLIKRYRGQNSLTQQALAEILCVDTTTVSRWERRRDKPELGIQRRLRDLLYRGNDSVLGALAALIDTSADIATLFDQDLKLVRASLPHRTLLRYHTKDFYGVDIRRLLSSCSAQLLGRCGLNTVLREAHHATMDTTLESFETFNNPEPVYLRAQIMIVRAHNQGPMLLARSTQIPSDTFKPSLDITLFDTLLS